MQSISHNLKHLPNPSPVALAHSEKLCAVIGAEITAQGAISFARYMELALYAPGLGYYSAGAQKFGAAGDFVTAPEISALFSRCLARQCQSILEKLGDGDILELGAGSGVMAADILLELETLQTLPQHYYILELSGDLKQRQQQLFQQKIPHLLNRIVWLNSLENFKLRGVILANEVLDAMPVHKFKIDKGVQEFYVTHHHNEFHWQVSATNNTELEKQVTALATDFPEAYESEINLSLAAWIQTLSSILQQGVLLCIDYGFPRHEFYLPERNTGTLMCHYQHRAHDNPLILTGLQDITAHVDFTAVANSALTAGLELAGYTTQAHFLLSCGITDIAQVADPVQQFALSQQLKKLIMPQEMGELFKVIALSRNFNTPLLGFKLNDMSTRLT